MKVTLRCKLVPKRREQKRGMARKAGEEGRRGAETLRRAAWGRGVRSSQGAEAARQLRTQACTSAGAGGLGPGAAPGAQGTCSGVLPARHQSPEAHRRLVPTSRRQAHPSTGRPEQRFQVSEVQ